MDIFSDPSVAGLIAEAARRFRAARLAFGHGTLNADDEAAWLVVHALGCPFEALPQHLSRPVPAAARRRAAQLIERRIAERIPAAYLTHEAWLGEHRFYVDERVIVPRSYIAELLRTRLSPWLPRRSPRTILDLCTGSGCLAIVAAHTWPGAAVDAVDLSPAALAVARRNRREHGLEKRLHLRQSDLFGALAGKTYDLILSNPPYVGAAAMRRLPAEYRHEPEMALAAGQDGLDLVRRILAEAPLHLNPGGWLVMEVGHYRARVEHAFPRQPFIWAQTSGGDDCVLLLQRESFPSAAGRAMPPRQSSARRRRA
ncbi:MAG: 50S ribosomal protein L3 N(5)-glutamine methyltransferase [Betaproteobacteria bacterium]|nr:50S ribosomal protein L3 N(5)-glutamine methyltransferase [Betaproteobacteria bacterium]